MSDVAEFVSETAREFTSADKPWTSTDRIKAEARKRSGVDYAAVPTTIGEMDRDELLVWHGLVTTTDADRLQAAIEQEADHDVNRKVLIGKLNAAKGVTNE